jgi:hypothetical protein
MERIKENAKKNFINMISNAWTVEKMTQKEWDQLINVFDSPQIEKALKGNYNQRWETLQAIFTSYLIGLGYDGGDWRNEELSTKKYFVKEGFY